MWIQRFLAIAIAFFYNLSDIKAQNIPMHIHIAYGEDATSMSVTWSTRNKTDVAICYYGTDYMKWDMKSTDGVSTKFAQGKNIQYIHKLRLSNLKPGYQYMYMCGDGKVMSDIYQFVAKQTDPNWAPSIVLFGDMGATNAQSLDRLREDIARGYYDAVFHVGDFAYNMDTNDGVVGDQFMQEIQPIAAQRPYMTCPGNHEQAGNFSNYKHRFAMPGDWSGDKMFYSFDMGPMHVISLSTEYYFFWQYGIDQMVVQFKWLQEDLHKANLNRDKVPWIVTMGHRPMYCSNLDNDDCTHDESLIRHGIPFVHLLSMEDLFDKYGVDIMFWAHEHSYERLWPVYNRKIYNGTKAAYTNPNAPVHIITGTAGCSEKHDPFGKANPWTAYRSSDYGYTRMKVYNATHVYIDQVSDDQGGAVVDRMLLIKDKHGPYDRPLKYKPHHKDRHGSL